MLSALQSQAAKSPSRLMGPLSLRFLSSSQQALEVKAVAFDLGGVVYESPLQAIVRYEKKHNLPHSSIGKVIVQNGHDGSFAKLERGELPLTEFYPLFERECSAVGISIDAKALFDDIHASLATVPAMLDAIDCIRAENIKTAAITNNWKMPGDQKRLGNAVTKRMDVVVESAVEGVRKPDVRIYELLCERLQVRPNSVVFLDDIGANLKPAAAMGMRTIKVSDPHQALHDLEAVLGFPLKGYVPGTVALQPGHQLNAEALRRYLDTALNIKATSLHIREFGHGQSNPTYYIGADTGEKLVLRKKPPGKLLKGAHMVEREYLVKKILRENGVAVPEVLALCEDAGVVGTPFYIMKYVPGRIFKDPTLPGLEAAERRAIYDAVGAALASIHNVDIQQPGLVDFGKHDDYFCRQIKTWALQSQASVMPPRGHEGAWEMKQLANMERLMEWLPANVPPAFPTTVVHGDFRIDNVIFDPREPRVLAILDWELSTLGDPMADLAYSAIPYHLPDSLPQIKGFASPDGRRPAGIPAEQEYVERYCGLRGIDVAQVMAHYNFYVAFGFFRITAILQGVYRRAQDGQGASKHAKQAGALAGFMSDLAVRAMNRQAALPRGARGMHTAPLGRRAYTTFAAGTTGASMSPKAQHLVGELKSFMDDHVYPNEKALLDHQFTPDRWTIPPVMEELKAKARARGLWNLFLPRESDPEMKYGAGLSNWEYAQMAEIMGRSLFASEAFNCSAPDTGNMEVLVRYGTEAQQKEWLIPLLEGKIRSCFAMTEPAVASSDATNIQSSIRRDGDHYVINGHKHWTSGAMDPRCAISILMGKTDPTAAVHAQQSMILVPMQTPGVKIVRPLTVFGYEDAPHGHAEVLFEDVRVPKENMLLGEGRGFEIAQGRLGPGRIHHCMRLIGAAERSLELMCQRVLQRAAFGKPLARQGTIQSDIAWSRAELEQARLLTLLAAHKMDTVGNKAARDLISMIKYVAPNMALRVMDRAMQAHGGLGLSGDLPIAQLYAAARTLRLADGPDEVHLASVAKQELAKHMPRK